MKIIGSLKSIDVPQVDLDYEVRVSSKGKLSLYLTKESYRRLLGSVMLMGLNLEDLGPVENLAAPQQEIEIS